MPLPSTGRNSLRPSLNGLFLTRVIEYKSSHKAKTTTEVVEMTVDNEPAVYFADFLKGVGVLSKLSELEVTMKNWLQSLTIAR